MERFDIRNFLTENKLTEQSRQLNEKSEFGSWLKKEWKRNQDKVAKAVEWFAGSVFGWNLPNNLHRKNVNDSHIKAVIETIEESNPESAEEKIKAFKKHMG